MIENVKAVNNPLTIIAIFAALAEVAGIGALGFVDPNLQHIFVWFVMGFPSVLIIAFFLTLNFNAKVLYAPSDFKDEGNFMNLTGIVNQQSDNLEEIESKLENAKATFEETLKQISGAGEAEREKLSSAVDSQIKSLEESINYAKDRNLQARFSLEAQNENQLKLNKSLSRWHTDELILVAVNSERHARWGDKLDFYARVINLTDKEIKILGNGAGASHINHGKYLQTQLFPFQSLPPKFISQPFYLLSLVLDKENFSKHTSPMAVTALVSYPDLERISENAPINKNCEPAVWVVNIL